MSLLLKVTDAGRQALVNAANTGTLPVTISQIALGSGLYAPTSNQTTLQNEIKRLTTFGGGAVADDVIHVTIQDDSSDAYSLGEFGLITNNGILFAVCSQENEFILQKNSGGILLLTADTKITTLDTSHIEFSGTNFLLPPGTTLIAGVLKIAEQTEALAGNSNTKAMTPALTKQVLNQHKNEDSAHDWSKIGGKPSAFPPAAHSHSWNEVTGKPASFTPAAHSHSWSEIAGRPATFPPAAHSHSWNEVTGKPASFTPAAHTHTLAQISDAGNAAKATLVESPLDIRPNRVLMTGYQGLGSQSGILLPNMQESVANGFYRVTVGFGNTYSSYIQFSDSSVNLTQLGGRTLVSTDFQFRKKVGGEWGPSYSFWHTGNVSSSVNDFLGKSDRAGMRVALGSSNIGASFLITPNTHAAGFPLANGNSSVFYLNATEYRTAIGANDAANINAGTFPVARVPIAAAANSLNVATVSQAEAEAGGSTALRQWSPQRVSQAIAALAGANTFSTARKYSITLTTNTGGAFEYWVLGKMAFGYIRGIYWDGQTPLDRNVGVLPSSSHRSIAVGAGTQLLCIEEGGIPDGPNRYPPTVFLDGQYIFIRAVGGGGGDYSGTYGGSIMWQLA